MRQEYHYFSTLLHRGWTPKLVTQLLGDPDKTVRNPHYGCAAPAKLYKRDRVEIAEKTEQFLAASAKKKKRQEVLLDAERQAREQQQQRDDEAKQILEQHAERLEHIQIPDIRIHGPKFDCFVQLMDQIDLTDAICFLGDHLPHGTFNSGMQVVVQSLMKRINVKYPQLFKHAQLLADRYC